MARRGNQQKNGVVRRMSKHAKRVSESGTNPNSKEQEKACDVKVSAEEEFPNGHHPTPDGSSANNINKTSHSLDGRDNPQHSGTFQSKLSQGIDEIREIEELVSSERNPNDCITSSLEPLGAGEGDDTLHGNGSDQKHTTKGLDYLLNHLHLISILMAKNFKTLSSSTLKTTGEWLERQRPSLVAFTNNLCVARDYVKLKICRAYPVLLKWLAYFGNILLLLSMVWLDCALRGVGSFLHMGTTSFFSVIWLSIFSLVAMAGMLKFLIFLAVAAFVGVFGGLILGLLILAITGTIFLWLYGSFWTTTLVIVAGGLAFMSSHERLMLLITTGYSLYCAWAYVGWFGVVVALNLSFFSTDILVYILRNTVHQHHSSSGPSEQFTGADGQPGFFQSEPSRASYSKTGQGFSSDRGPGIPSTSEVESELTSEDEVLRLLRCSDHYQALGLSRYGNVDVSLLKKEYRKKAMLVHPDKNMGNEKAAEAFKKLQNAYEVLLDSLKRKDYDDELRREELLNYFRRFQSPSQKNGEHGLFASGFARAEGDGEDPFGDSRRMACERCSSFHIWVHTKKPKTRARWCQDCNDFHQAKDGDGWVEQFSQPFMFGILQKVNAPSAYVCADSKIYDVTEWFICQEMRCPANTHKPSFHVNTSVTSSKHSSSSKRSNPGQRGNKMPAANDEEPMNSEVLYEWFQNAVRSGMFDNVAASADTPPAAAGGSVPKSAGSSGGSSSSNKKKKKGKKQW